MSALRRALINIIKNDFIVNVTHMRDKGMEREIGRQGGSYESVYFLSMSSEAGYRMAHALATPRSISEAIDR